MERYASIECVDEDASSTSQLILEFVFKCHLKLTDTIAKNLFCGIVSDTGRFMHDYTSKRTFELVTKMFNKVNINFTSLYEPLYMRPFSEIKFQGYIFQNMTVSILLPKYHSKAAHHCNT